MSAGRGAMGVALAVLLVGAIYVGLLSLLPRDSLWSGDQGAKLVQVVSLLRARLTSLAIPDPSLAYEPDGLFSALPALYTWARDGSHYSIFSYPHALATAPPFFLLGYDGLYVVPLLATLGTLTISAALAARLELRSVWAVPLLLGLATPLGFYALVFWEHALATLLVAGALLAAIDASGQVEGASGRRWPLVLAGLLAGLAWWFRAEALWAGPALLVGIAWASPGWRGGTAAGGMLRVSAGLAAALGPLVLFNLALYGTPLGAQVAANFGEPDMAPGMTASRLQVAGDLLVGPSQWWPVWLGAWLGAILAATTAPALRPWAVAGLALCAAGGLLATQPYDLHWTGAANAATLILLAPLGLRLYHARPAARLLGGAALVYTVGVLLSAPNSGGAQWGPRYLLPVLPAAAVLALAAARRLIAPAAPGRALAAGALLILIAACIGTQARGVELLERSLADNQRIVRVVNARPAGLIVTDAPFGPQLLAPLFFERPILYVQRPEFWPPLRELLGARRVDAFTYLTSQPRAEAPARLAPYAIGCELVEGLAYGLSAFDCRIEP